MFLCIDLFCTLFVSLIIGINEYKTILFMNTIKYSLSRKVMFSGIIMIMISFQLTGQKNYPPDITCDEVVTYKSADNIDLKLWIFNPAEHSPDAQSPAIVFYFGGGWNAGSPEQFVKHCEYLSARGMVAMVADYRVASRNDVRAKTCVADAKSAVRWIREHAGELGVDPGRIAAGGGSAGGHLAAATATLTKFDEAGKNLKISSRPNALVLFNPVLILAPLEDVTPEEKKKLKNLEDRLGAKPEDMSPYHNISPGIAPTIIFHGTSDKTVPFNSVEEFTTQMKKAGNSCILAAYENEGHGFFNYGKKDNGAFVSTVSLMDEFFVKMGWLKAVPEPL